VRKLFIELIGGKKFFSTEPQQRAILANLLDILYPTETLALKIQRKMDILLEILGLHWKTSAVAVPTNRQDLIKKPQKSSRRFTIDSVIDDEVFRLVLIALFQQHPTSLVIENAHYCDSISWSVLKLISALPIDLVALITVKKASLKESTPTGMFGIAPTPRNQGRKRKMESSNSTGPTASGPVMQGYAVAQQYVDALVLLSAESGSPHSIGLKDPKLPSRGKCNVLEMVPFNRDDIKKLLESVLGKDISSSSVQSPLFKDVGNKI
jgi:hypothetical protein